MMREYDPLEYDDIRTLCDVNECCDCPRMGDDCDGRGDDEDTGESEISGDLPREQRKGIIPY